MIDARVAANMLLMLEPKIVEAQVVLEAAGELRAIVQAAQQPLPAPAPAVAQEPLPNANNDDKEPAAGPAGGG